MCIILQMLVNFEVHNFDIDAYAVIKGVYKFPLICVVLLTKSQDKNMMVEIIVL